MKKKRAALRTGYIEAQLRVMAETSKTRVLVPVKVRAVRSGGTYGTTEFEVLTPWAILYRVNDKRFSATEDLVAGDGMPFEGVTLREQMAVLVKVAEQREQAAEKKQARRR